MDRGKPRRVRRDGGKLDEVVARARGERDSRESGYRARSLAIHPWVCARCGREFTAADLHLLTVHHKDHDHDNNPADGSNWEHLCVYCHENEHARVEDHLAGGGRELGGAAAAEDDGGNRPLAGLRDLLKRS